MKECRLHFITYYNISLFIGFQETIKNDNKNVYGNRICVNSVVMLLRKQATKGSSQLSQHLHVQS